MPSRWSRLLATGAVAASLLLVACGGDDPDEADDSGGGAMTSNPTSTESVATSTPSPTSATTEAGSGGGGGVTGFPSQACQDAALATSDVFDIMTPGGSITDEDLGEYQQALERARANAPSEIRDDLEVFGDLWTRLREVIADSNWDPASGQIPPASVLAAFQEFDTPEIEAAAESLGEWFAENCPSE